MLSIKKTYLTEILLFIYLIYSQIIAVLWISIPRLSFIILIITYCSTFLFTIQNRNKLRKMLRPWLLLSSWCIIGLVVALNKSIVINQTIDFISGIILISIIYCISEKEKSIISVVNIFFIFSLIITIITLKNGVNFNKYASILRMSYSENINSNEVGYILTIGMWCGLYKLCDRKKGSIINITVNLISICVMFYIILLTNSRKSIIGVILIFILWFFLCYGGEWRKLKLYQKNIISLLIILIMIYGVKFIKTDILLSTSNYMDRLDLLISDGASTRVELIKDAFNVFLKNPILGVGLNNYQYYSIYQMYSHCEYVEILACTGLVGAILYFTVYFSIVEKIIGYRKFFLNAGTHYKNKYYTICILFAFIVYIGIGRIHMYSDNSMYTFGIIIAFMIFPTTRSKQSNHNKM